jgi:hypothetical protein
VSSRREAQEGKGCYVVRDSEVWILGKKCGKDHAHVSSCGSESVLDPERQ